MSTATTQPEYAALLARTLPAVIHSEKENERCISLLEALDRKAQKLTAAERRLAELLTVLIEDFGEEAYALKPARLVEVLRELMESNRLKQKDLLGIFGSPSIVSEVLREKRGLTVDDIRKLSCGFHVSPEVFFQIVDAARSCSSEPRPFSSARCPESVPIRRHFRVDAQPCRRANVSHPQRRLSCQTWSDSGGCCWVSA